MHTTADQLPSITSKTSVFGLAVATFYAPSDPSGRHGMRCEHIRSTPSWRGCKQWHDCAFVIMDDSKPGMMGMNVIRVLLFFFIWIRWGRVPLCSRGMVWDSQIGPCDGALGGLPWCYAGQMRQNHSSLGLIFEGHTSHSEVWHAMVTTRLSFLLFSRCISSLLCQ